MELKESLRPRRELCVFYCENDWETHIYNIGLHHFSIIIQYANKAAYINHHPGSYHPNPIDKWCVCGLNRRAVLLCVQYKIVFSNVETYIVIQRNCFSTILQYTYICWYLDQLGLYLKFSFHCSIVFNP